jgi:pyrroloquinoline quinone biosynthesis protein B
MRIRVLGSAAGGGFPQWNCNCRNCDGVRTGGIRAQPRTQSSIAVTADDLNWVLFNASPDILQQLKANRELQPARAIRDTGITAVILIDAQIDHTTGLLMLREGQRPLQIYCTDMVHEDLSSGNPLFRILGHYCGVEWRRIGDGNGYAGFTIPGAPGLAFQAMPLKSAAPPYSPHRADPHPGDNIGVRITDTASDRSVFYAPGLGEIEAHVEVAMRDAHCVMVDGTFWTDDEMIRLGISKKRAREIGHLPQSGEGGMMEWMDRFPKPRKILIHINNTNPILNDDSIERAELARRGIEVAFDGMDIRI